MFILNRLMMLTLNQTKRTAMRLKICGLIFIATSLLIVFGLYFYSQYKVQTEQAQAAKSPNSIKIDTNYYKLHLSTTKIKFPTNVGVYSAIDKLNDGLLWATSYSDFYLINKNLEPTQLNIPRIKTNREFIVPLLEENLKPAELYFTLKDISLKKRKNTFKLLASHHYWDKTQQCFIMKLSEFNFSESELEANKFNNEWETLYQTSPCVKLFNNPEANFSGDEAGGRIAFLDNETILLTVGHHENDGRKAKDHFSGQNVPNYPQDPNISYGKIVRINIADKTSSIYSLGHRNPQGLYINDDKIVYETEHGPKGGDELNIIKENSNYGWPVVTYGTKYGDYSWPLTEPGTDHGKYTEPLYAWVPSIAISNLIQIKSDYFKFWKNDLVIGSLRAQSLYRVKLDLNRIIYIEPIQVNQDVRDIVELNDGRIAFINRGNKISILSLSESDE